MTTTTKEFIVALELTPRLVEDETIERFDFNGESNEGLLKLNGVHNEIPLIIFPITFDKFGDVKNENIEYLIKKLDEEYNIDSFDTGCIIEVLHLEINKEKMIHTIKEYNIYKLNQSIQEQIQKEQKEREEQENRPISVIEAIRTPEEGPALVTGRISGITITYKAITKLDWKCAALDCDNQGSQSFDDFPLEYLPKIFSVATNSPTSVCFRCKSTGFEITKETIKAKKIWLDDIENIEDQYDRLHVILYGDAIDNIVSGEIVDIRGNIRIQPGSGERSKKLINVLHSRNIVSRSKEKIQLTEKDVDVIKRWKDVCDEKYKKDFELIKKYPKCPACKHRKTNHIYRIVVSMFAPNVVGHNDKKIGILRSVVGGNKISGIDNGRRGRINTLLVETWVLPNLC